MLLVLLMIAFYNELVERNCLCPIYPQTERIAESAGKRQYFHQFIIDVKAHGIVLFLNREYVHFTVRMDVFSSSPVNQYVPFIFYPGADGVITVGCNVEYKKRILVFITAVIQSKRIVRAFAPVRGLGLRLSVKPVITYLPSRK
jgi:hypothetical protein